MDYENKYNEALQKARAINSGKYVDIPAKDTVLEYIFPEIKSEDERIRNGIIALLKFSLEDGSAIAPGFNETKEQALAWLEKQCNTSKKVTCTHEVEVGNGNIKALVTEEIPTDMIKPKFHEGEWITNGEYTWEIVEINPLDYILQSQDGNIVDDAIPYVDRQFHSFTIEDAKDGDVLQLGNVTAIFQEYIGNGNCKCYCSVYKGEFSIPSQDDADESYGCHNAHPATKEQFDLLFSKMKEAGFEWDSEKKELKKIEFNPDDIIEESYQQQADDLIDVVTEKSAWSEEDESMLECALDMVEWYIGRNETKCRSVSDWLKSIKQRIEE